MYNYEELGEWVKQLAACKQGTNCAKEVTPFLDLTQFEGPVGRLFVFLLLPPFGHLLRNIKLNTVQSVSRDLDHSALGRFAPSSFVI